MVWPSGTPTPYFYYHLHIPSMAGHHVYGTFEFSSQPGALTNFHADLDGTGMASFSSGVPTYAHADDSVTFHTTVAMGTPPRGTCEFVLAPAWDPAIPRS
jgi:hypothetical protein